MTPSRVRAVLPAVYAIAIVLAALLGNGTALVVVAVVGAMALGLAYTLLRDPAQGRQRDRSRGRDRARRRG